MDVLISGESGSEIDDHGRTEKTSFEQETSKGLKVKD